MFVLIQMVRIIRGGWILGQQLWGKFGPASQHALLLVLLVVRVLDCSWFAGYLEVPIIVGAALSAVPYLLVYWIFSLLIFQWMSVVHQPMRRAEDTFAKIRPLFVWTNIGVAVMIAGLFGALVASTTGSGSEEDDYGRTVALVGSVVVACITLVTGLALVYYGRAVASTIESTSATAHTTSGFDSERQSRGSSCCPWLFGAGRPGMTDNVIVASRMRRIATTIATAFIAQSLAWVLSTWFAPENGSEPAAVGYLVLLGVWLFTDFLALLSVIVIYRRFVQKLHRDASKKASEASRSLSVGGSSFPRRSASQPTAPPFPVIGTTTTSGSFSLSSSYGSSRGSFGQTAIGAHLPGITETSEMSSTQPLEEGEERVVPEEIPALNDESDDGCDDESDECNEIGVDGSHAEENTEPEEGEYESEYEIGGEDEDECDASEEQEEDGIVQRFIDPFEHGRIAENGDSDAGNEAGVNRVE